jgi:hypothetical protein
MDIHKFIENFLPDCEAKYRQFYGFKYSEGKWKGVDKKHDAGFIYHYFPEAIKNYK